MILQVFSVYDVKSDLYGTPFFMASRGQAIRAFSDLVNDTQSQVNRYPDDFVLRVIGSFSDGSGELSAVEKPENLGFARDYLKTDKPAPVVRRVEEIS